MPLRNGDEIMKEIDMASQVVGVGDIKIGKGHPLVLIAGPCVIESFEITYDIARFVKELTDDLKIPFIFKASYDKANRTSLSSYRGPGLKEGLSMLSEIKERLGICVLSDVHSISEIPSAASVLDVLQIPAFLCRQTDFVVEAARSGRPINVKKGQFLAPWDIRNVIEKISSSGNRQVVVTERGVSFGYNNLVVDFRGLAIMRSFGLPVVFDATHSVQLPGGAGSCSGGQREFAPVLARAAVAAGVDGIFMEVHSDPDCALCDGPNSLHLRDLKKLLVQLVAIHKITGSLGTGT
jgi:2-dehydro-3-deoxyphosphooctonate aldolase (KDO 8-P synthase)